MKTISLANTYDLKWRFKNHAHIVISTTKEIINTKTNRIIKETVNGGYSKGFWIDRKFIPTPKINQYVELITDDDCPF